MEVLPQLVKLAKELDIKYVATNDIHYVKKEDAESQDVRFAYRQTVWSPTETA